ncbi:TetR/AcrR family transcriptional regulator [Glycomyces sp. L485]|uniref:TetR/AcrR family transcriptional regulator n=1 Tax=Glycomyces sp. L485 TaxID=2909235 RepID=UPI001F4AF8BA|nr:TetR/AcrR family transcriptional regulator [Glycomyces sp. L485]MCH7231279.1 TetR/AcrR family transcriptional regulator [Glycomyces sp. L485]
MNAPRTARERARAELTKEILSAAKHQLGEVGPSALSLRAVARELGMASSAIYRYFPSRDELLTALILDGYNDIGSAAEGADDPAAEPGERWLAIWRAVREWSMSHRYEFALLFGTPVPGYAAPQETATAAGRMPLALARVLSDAKAAGKFRPPPGPSCDPSLVEPGMLDLMPGEDLVVDEVARGILAWNRLVGVISFELHGHLNNVTADDAGFFEYTARMEGTVAGVPFGDA